MPVLLISLTKVVANCQENAALLVVENAIPCLQVASQPYPGLHRLLPAAVPPCRVGVVAEVSAVN